MSAPRPLRGEIWEFHLNPKRGREQRGIRPCLVVSTNAMNRSEFGTVIICPITTRERPSFRWRPGLVPADLRLADTSWEALPHWVATDQIVTVDTAARARRHLASVQNRDKLIEIDESLRLMLAL
ncbi:MAG: type II toxin-antitoxin system PemK/MazF family toxin [Acidobacteriota bacterium]